MSESKAVVDNAAIVEAALTSARAGRLEEAESYFSPDMVLHVAESLPHGGTYRGWAGYVECLAKLKSFWSATTLHNQAFVSLGDQRVAVSFELDGRIARNGAHVQMPIVAIWELEDGKIVRIRPYYFDTKQFCDLVAA